MKNIDPRYISDGNWKISFKKYVLVKLKFWHFKQKMKLKKNNILEAKKYQENNVAGNEVYFLGLLQ